MPNDQLDELLNRLVSGTGEINSAELEQLRFAIFGTPENEKPSALADIAAALEAPENDEQDESAPCELQSAEDYLARVAAEDQDVPASLLRLVGAAPAARTTIQIANRGSRLAGLRRQQVLGWGSAIAATVLAGISGYVAHDFVVRNPAAPGSAISPNDVADARAPQSTNSTVANAGALPPQESGSSANAPVPTMAVTPPTPLTSHAVTQDDYPPDSIRLQEQGTVKVKYLVLINGSVGQCQVEISSGYPSLDDAACAVVKRWQFKPGTIADGSSVEWWLDAGIVFRLAGAPAPPAPPQSPAAADAQSSPTPGRSLQTKNEALVKAINEMNAAARAQNWTLALQKAKEADAISNDKPTALNAPIHTMIVTAAINAKDYATALAQIDKNIAANEGDRTKNLEQALSVAIMAKNKEKADQYAKELGGSLDNATRVAPAPSRPPQAPAVQSAGNKESLLTVFLQAGFAEQAHRWAECLEKAREADAIKSDKSPKAEIHRMIISCAVNSRDYAAALGQLDQNIATGEGNMELNLTLAQTYATMSKNKEKADQYESRLKRLLAGITPPVATTSHAVTADDYPPDSIHQQEQGNVVVMYLVNEGGSVDACNVIASSGYSRLDIAACLMVTKRWKFKPAIQNGKPVPGYLTAEVVFQLK